MRTLRGKKKKNPKLISFITHVPRGRVTADEDQEKNASGDAKEYGQGTGNLSGAHEREDQKTLFNTGSLGKERSPEDKVIE